MRVARKYLSSIKRRRYLNYPRHYKTVSCHFRRSDSSSAWARVATSANVLKGFRIRQLLIIDSYHRSYLHDFYVSMRPLAFTQRRAKRASCRRRCAYTYPIYVPSLSSVFLIAAKVIEKSSRSISEREPCARKIGVAFNPFSSSQN